MSEIEPGTIQDLLAELVACAGVFDVSTNYEADKVSLEKATQAVLDHVRTLRDERDRLRSALEDACLTYAVHGEQPPEKWLAALTPAVDAQDEKEVGE